MSHMERIGVRELRQNASKYLKRVEAGETIEVSDRGRPVARIVPIGLTGWDRLVAEGRVRHGEGDPRQLPDLIAPAPGVPLPSQLVSQGRQE